MRTLQLSAPLTKTNLSDDILVPVPLDGSPASTVRLHSAAWDDGDYVDVTIDDEFTTGIRLGRYWKDAEITFERPVTAIHFVGVIAGNNTSVSCWAAFHVGTLVKYCQRTFRRITTALAGTPVAVTVPELATKGCMCECVLKGTWTAGGIDTIDATDDGVTDTLWGPILADEIEWAFAGKFDSFTINVGAAFDGTVDVMFSFWVPILS